MNRHTTFKDVEKSLLLMEEEIDDLKEQAEDITMGIRTQESKLKRIMSRRDMLIKHRMKVSENLDKVRNLELETVDHDLIGGD